MELKGSKTEANLWKAFAGESMARNKYTYFASKAKKEGFEQIAAIFEETAGNEKEHAKLWFKELGGIGDTAANLKAAAAGENEEWTQMYKEMAETAKAEGFEKLAFLFEGVGKIEKEHEERYLTLLKNLEEVETAANLVQQAAHPDALIIFGAAFDDTLEDEIRVTVIATGFEEREGAMPSKPFTAAGEKKAEAQPQAKTESAAPAEDDPFEDIFKIFNRGK